MADGQQLEKGEEMTLRLPQVRVLKALEGGGILTRTKMCERAGLSPISGTIWRALNGLKEGSSSGPPQLGLLALGYVEEHKIEVEEGMTEIAYRITSAGREALKQVDDAPAVRDGKSSTNHRYRRSK